MKNIYMDNNATTRVAPEVLEAMAPYFCDLYGNPSSMHTFGGQVGSKLVAAREQVAALIGAHPDEIIFTSCGTESDNTAIESCLKASPKRRHVITTRVEHPAVLNTCKLLSKRGYRVTFIGVDHLGNIDLDHYRSAIDDDTAIVSIMAANNETGNIFPIEEMAALAKENGATFHTDAVQAVGKVDLDMQRSAVDMLALSGHKLHAPKGIGALYIRKGTKFNPFMVGGHQEHGRRGGTENVPGIIALGRACKLAQAHLVDENTQVLALRDQLETRLLQAATGAFVNGNPEARLPNTTNISFEYVEGEAILLLLNKHGIAASSGSACTSGSLEPSHVLRAMGVPYTRAHGSIRFSLSRYNTAAEVDTVVETLPPVINRLREISPYV